MELQQYIDMFANVHAPHVPVDTIRQEIGDTTDRNLINKVIIELASRHTKSETAVDIPSGLIAIRDHVIEYGSTGETIEQVERTIKSLEEEVSYHYAEARKRTQYRLEEQRKLTDLINHPDRNKGRWFQSITKSLSNPNFILLDIRTRSREPRYGVDLVYCTNDIICGHRDRENGYNHFVNLGKFIVHVYLKHNEWHIDVKPFVNNRYAKSYYHPHVSSGGDVCWGTASEQANKAYNDMDVNQMLNALYSLLTQYNPDNPYIYLSCFDISSSDYSDMESHTDIERAMDAYEEDPDEDMYDLADRKDWFIRDQSTLKSLSHEQLIKYRQVAESKGLLVPEYLPKPTPPNMEELSKLYGKMVQFRRDTNGDVVVISPLGYSGAYDKVRSDTSAVMNREGSINTGKYSDCKDYSELTHEEITTRINQGIETKDYATGTMFVRRLHTMDSDGMPPELYVFVREGKFIRVRDASYTHYASESELEQEYEVVPC